MPDAFLESIAGLVIIDVTALEAAVRQPTDPGAIGAGELWVDTSHGWGRWIVWQRNATDTGWQQAHVSNSMAGDELAVLTVRALAERLDALETSLPTLADPQRGDLARYNGTAWERLSIGERGRVLFVSDDDMPEWGLLAGGVTVRNLVRSPDGSAALSPSGDDLVTTT